MAYVQTQDPRVARETTTGGLVATNTAELFKHRSSRNMTKRLIHHRQLADLKAKDFESRLDRCESLLAQLSQHVTALTHTEIPVPRRSED